jgi:predicted ester cyclase
LAWFYWTAKGKITGNEIQIPVHHAFRFENEKIVDVYHFFDPTLLDAELAASQK